MSLYFFYIYDKNEFSKNGYQKENIRKRIITLFFLG